MDAGKYELHRIFKGQDEILGNFTIDDEVISFSSKGAEKNCSIFPAGKISESTSRRLTHMLDNQGKSMYVTKV